MTGSLISNCSDGPSSITANAPKSFEIKNSSFFNNSVVEVLSTVREDGFKIFNSSFVPAKKQNALYLSCGGEIESSSFTGVWPASRGILINSDVRMIINNSTFSNFDIN